MNSNDSKIFLEDQQNDFLYKKSKSNIDISFNRVAFIFFIFFIIFLGILITAILGPKGLSIFINIIFL